MHIFTCELKLWRDYIYLYQPNSQLFLCHHIKIYFNFINTIVYLHSFNVANLRQEKIWWRIWYKQFLLKRHINHFYASGFFRTKVRVSDLLNWWFEFVILGLNSSMKPDCSPSMRTKLTTGGNQSFCFFG